MKRSNHCLSSSSAAQLARGVAPRLFKRSVITDPSFWGRGNARGDAPRLTERDGMKHTMSWAEFLARSQLLIEGVSSRLVACRGGMRSSVTRVARRSARIAFAKVTPWRDNFDAQAVRWLSARSADDVPNQAWFLWLTEKGENPVMAHL